MFFLIGGIQPRTRTLQLQQRACPRCSYYGLQEKRVDSYFSLFFIPLFPVKKGVPFKQCINCNSVFDQKGSQIEHDGVVLAKNCPQCRKGVAEDFIYCPYCSYPLKRR